MLLNPLDYIRRYESGDRNVFQNVVSPNISTAQGYYQITNTNWRNLGYADIYPGGAMTAPFDVQSGAAATLYQQSGFQPWADFNPQLNNAITNAGGPGAFTPQSASFDELAPSGLTGGTSDFSGTAIPFSFGPQTNVGTSAGPSVNPSGTGSIGDVFGFSGQGPSQLDSSLTPNSAAGNFDPSYGTGWTDPNAPSVILSDIGATPGVSGTSPVPHQPGYPAPGQPVTDKSVTAAGQTIATAVQSGASTAAQTSLAEEQSWMDWARSTTIRFFIVIVGLVFIAAALHLFKPTAIAAAGKAV
jgi:hypothetical protein